MSKKIFPFLIVLMLFQPVTGSEVEAISIEDREIPEDSLSFKKLKALLQGDLHMRGKIPYARKGLTLAQKNNDFTNQLYFTMALGRMYEDLSISDEAIGYYLQGRGFARILKDTLGLVNACNALAGIYLENGLVQKALKFNNQATALTHDSFNPREAGHVFELKGRIKLENDELFIARDNFNKAIKYFKKAGYQTGILRQKIFIARVYENNHLFNQALEMLREVEKNMSKVEDIGLKSQVFQDMARVYEGIGRFEKALSYALKADKLPHTENFFPSLVKTYELKSSILDKMGQKDEALKSYKKYMALRDSLDEKNTRQEIMKFEVKHRAMQQKRKNQLLEAELSRQRELRNIFLMVALGSILAIAGIYTFYRYKQQQKRTRNLSSFNKQLEARVKEKTRELEIEIEERIKKTNEAVKARQKAEESDKLKTEFLNNISHEVRTPMNRIMGFSDLLLDEAPNLQVQDYAKVIYNDSQRLLKLITDLIELSRLRSENIHPEKEIFELEEFLEEVYRAYENKFPAEISFRLHLPGNYSGFKIHSDKNRLKKVLIHLLENSLKFTHTGWIELGVKEKGSSKLLLYVSDTGEGIEKSKSRHIFGFFSQGDGSLTREKAGIGAGLTIVKHLTEILGGTVNLHTTHGHGTTFQLEFDIENLRPGKGRAVSSKTLVADDLGYRWNGKRILILDDRESNMRYLKSALKETGAEVHWAVAIDKAVNLLNSYNDMDLVILNEVFDNQHARKFVPKIKSIKYTLPVIVQRSDQMNDFPWESGADGFVTKPVSYRVLMEKIASLLKV